MFYRVDIYKLDEGVKCEQQTSLWSSLTSAKLAMSGAATAGFQVDGQVYSTLKDLIMSFPDEEYCDGEILDELMDMDSEHNVRVVEQMLKGKW